MMTATDLGQFVIEISDDPIDERSECERDSAKQVRNERSESPDSKTVVIRVRSCLELEETLSRLVQSGSESEHRTIVIPNLLDAFYDTSMLTREAAQSLGRVKSLLELLVENGVQVVALCQRRSDDLGTRSHFMASLCASADQVHFRKRT